MAAMCRNHPDTPATHVADAAVAHPPYREQIPLCGECAPRMAAIGFPTSAPPGAPLTDEELAILDLLAEASSRFFRLPEHHSMDAEEWAHEVHHLQQLIMCRAAIRAYPDRFTAMVGPVTALEREHICSAPGWEPCRNDGHAEWLAAQGAYDVDPMAEVECEVEGCTYRNRIIHGTSWAYHYVNEHGGFGEAEGVDGLVIP